MVRRSRNSARRFRWSVRSSTGATNPRAPTCSTIGFPSRCSRGATSRQRRPGSRWAGRALRLARDGVGAMTRVAGLVILFVVLFLFRLATASITNDDYLHLSTAQQVVLGAVPVRDFLDPGELLFYSTSAAAQWLLGRSVLSEVLLDAVLLSMGQVLVFALASRAARSTAVGLLAALFPIVLVSRLYSYPKTFLYAVALMLAWRYLDTRRRELL